MIENRKFTDSSLWLCPMYGLAKQEYDSRGLINAFAQDENKMFLSPVCLLLFGELELYGDKQGDLVTLFDDLVLDVYPYPGDMTMVALKIPDEFIDDYHLIVNSKYSQLSDLYKELVSEKVWARYESPDNITIAKEKRLQLQIIDKDRSIRKLTGLSRENEVWPDWNWNRETITNQLINNLQNGNKI